MPTFTYIPLATYTVTGSSDTEVVFSSIPSSYRDLVLVVNGTQTANTANGGWMRLNGDSSNSYSRVRMRGSGSATSSDILSGTEMEAMVFFDAVTTHIIQIMDYSTTNKHKIVLGRTTGIDFGPVSIAGRWANTAAVTSITLGVYARQFSVGSTFSLYGIMG